MQSERDTLRRVIGLPQATALVAGTIIGASIFVQPSEITARIPSESGVLLVWLLSGALTLCGALVCAELASAFPHTGGVYVFLRETYSPAVGFLWGWAMFWVMHSGIIAAIAVIFSRYLSYFVPLGELGLKVASIAVIVALTAINYRGVRQGSTLQTLFTAGKVLAIAAIVILGVIFGERASTAGVAGEVTASNFLHGLAGGLFAYGGWHMVTYNAGETRNAAKTIPRALVAGTILVTACYIALNAVYAHVLGLHAMASSSRVAADLADALFGSGGGGFMSALVIFSTFGALNGIILAGPRVYLSMARDGLLFRWAGAVHSQYRTPHRALLLQAAWASVLVLTGSYKTLFTRVVYTEWIFFGLLAMALFVLRRRGAGYRPPYRVWGYPVLPAIFAAAAWIIVVHQVAAQPLDSLIGLGVVVAGLPVYWIWTKYAS